MVVTAVDTLTVEPFNAPGCQVNPAAPDAESVMALPAQMLPPAADMVTPGITVTVEFAAAAQLPESPERVYTVVADGLSV
jgi:hypothetical protein